MMRSLSLDSGVASCQREPVIANGPDLHRTGIILRKEFRSLLHPLRYQEDHLSAKEPKQVARAIARPTFYPPLEHRN